MFSKFPNSFNSRIILSSLLLMVEYSVAPWCKMYLRYNASLRRRILIFLGILASVFVLLGQECTGHLKSIDVAMGLVMCLH